MNERIESPQCQMLQVMNRVVIERVGDAVYVFDRENMFQGAAFELSLDEARRIGTVLRDVTDDSLVESGCAGMDPSAYSLDKDEYEEEIRES